MIDSRAAGRTPATEEGPHTTFSKLPVQREREELRSLFECSRQWLNYAKNVCIHQIIEHQVDLTPDAAAVTVGTTVLSYRALNRRANHLARELIVSGIGPEVPVGVCMERSLDLAVATIGLFKAGGVLVPLDPENPRERLQSILEQAAPPVIVGQRRFVNCLPPHRATVICLEDIAEELAAPDGPGNPIAQVTSDNLCAIFFTSGSSGEPKAVLVPHRVGCRMLWAQANAIRLGPSDRTLLTSSINFAGFLGQLCGPLFAGATVVMARPGGYQDVDYLVKAIDEHGITVVGLVPAVLRQLVQRIEEMGGDVCRSLRHIASQGEALPPDLQGLLLSRLDADLHKFYGLTEAPVVTYWNCRHGKDADRTTIGRPTDMEVYLLDSNLEPVPVGEPGEIYVSGPGMARGYLGRPDLTAERFIPNHLGKEPGARLYRTGDLGRWLPEGVIEFLGRVDEQVKVRGVRIEVREIELVLAQHPEVAEVVVALQESRPGESRLAAWVVAKPDWAPRPEEMREFLRERLPGPMIPAAFFLVTALPRTPNGKVDRRAVSALAPDGLHGPRAILPPCTGAEKALADIWADVLELDAEKIGVTDDFHELGGHSLLIVRMLAQIEKRLGQAISVTTFLQAPTIRQLARLLPVRESSTRQQMHRNRKLPACDPTAAPFDRTEPRLFCLNYGYQLGKYLGKVCSVYAIELTREDRVEHADIGSLASALIGKVRAIQPQGPYVLFGFNSNAVVALAMAQQLSQQGQEVGLLALAELPLSVSRNGGIVYRSCQTLMHWVSRVRAHGSWFLHNSPKHWLGYLRGRVRAAGHVFGHDVLGKVSASDKAAKTSTEIALERSIAGYVLEPHDGRVALFVNQAAAANSQRLQRKWRKMGLGSLEITGLPGHHGDMMQEPSINILAKHLGDRIHGLCRVRA